MKIFPKSIYNWYKNTLRHPQYRWWIIIGTLVYLLSPLDISPDIIPIAGQVDDFVILTVFITEVSQMLVDAIKSRQENIASSPKNASSEAEANTVDVDAVSMD